MRASIGHVFLQMAIAKHLGGFDKHLVDVLVTKHLSGHNWICVKKKDVHDSSPLDFVTPGLQINPD
jgi:hypothetical protein